MSAPWRAEARSRPLSGVGLILPNPEPRTPDRESVSGRALELRLHTATPEETEALGRRLGGLLRAGDVIALSGDLGAGKTVLARGIAAGAGAAGHVASPTFTFLREYHGPVTIYHADLYRLVVGIQRADEPPRWSELRLQDSDASRYSARGQHCRKSFGGG